MIIKKSETKIEINVPPNKEWKNYFISIGFIFVICPIYFFMLFKHLISSENIDFKIIFFQVFVNLIIIFIPINYSLWLLIGKEKVTFFEDELVFKKTNGIFSSNRKLKIINIKNLKIIEKVYNTDSPFFRDPGRVRFDYNGTQISILRGLKDNELEEVQEIFKNQINKKTSHNSGLQKLGFWS